VAAGDIAGLIAAVNTANADGSGDTIVLAENSTYDFSAADNTTNGANALPVITAAGLTIQGNNAIIERVRSGSPPAFRLLDVTSGANVTISALTIANGLIQGPLAQGGGIFNAGQLTLMFVGINGSDQALGEPGTDAQGGGIYNAAGASLTIT